MQNDGRRRTWPTNWMRRRLTGVGGSRKLQAARDAVERLQGRGRTELAAATSRAAASLAVGQRRQPPTRASPCRRRRHTEALGRARRRRASAGARAHGTRRGHIPRSSVARRGSTPPAAHGLRPAKARKTSRYRFVREQNKKNEARRPRAEGNRPGAQSQLAQQHSLILFSCKEEYRNGDGQKRQTTIAKNILRYLPVLPRIQRLFMTEDTAQMRRSAVTISTDGFNPYGPKYPGKNMNVYLEPLVDDLVRGWEGRGIRTYDASKKEYFDMYVWYHMSLHDLPARALFCGWCTHGKWPCPQCRQAVTFFWLNKGGKYSCFDEARQFLERRHAYRSDVKSFKKGRVIRGPKPIPKTGTEIKAELDALQPSPDGNGFLGYGETHQWTHKPCLWKLPYFEFLELPHNIDVMHIENNISEAIWSTIVDTEKTKDNIKARIDQEM
ncbi:hypothetical protein QYE76_017897, partial [Lolium multiflorum]